MHALQLVLHTFALFDAERLTADRHVKSIAFLVMSQTEFSVGYRTTMSHICFIFRPSSYSSRRQDCEEGSTACTACPRTTTQL